MLKKWPAMYLEGDENSILRGENHLVTMLVMEQLHIRVSLRKKGDTTLP
jgi:hypothetical protein